MKKLLGIFLAFIIVSQAIAAEDIPVDPKLGERIEFVRSNRTFPVNLETTIFQPNAPVGTKFPIVIYNHGKAAGLNFFQNRARPISIVRTMLARGYIVAVPNRQGFSNSGGRVVGEGCDIYSNGVAQADDVDATVKWLKTQPWADTSRIVMMGQSHGGLTTLAYAMNPDPGVKVFVNFAGGLKWITGGCAWERNLEKAFEDYGSKTKVSSLWFYGANDSYFPPSVINPAYQAYANAGGKAKMIAFPAFGADAHGMSGSRDGIDIWLPEVLSAMFAQGLPTQVVYPGYEFKKAFTRPAIVASGFASLTDVQAVPYLKESGKKGYELFLSKSNPKAFVIHESGAWTWANGSNDENEDPNVRALNNCERRVKAACKLYAVDSDVVWIK